MAAQMNEDVFLRELGLMVKQEWDNMMLNRRLSTLFSWLSWVVWFLLIGVATYQATYKQGLPVHIASMVIVILSALNVVVSLVQTERGFKQRYTMHDRRWRQYSDIKMQLAVDNITLKQAQRRFSAIYTQSPEDLIGLHS